MDMESLDSLMIRVDALVTSMVMGSLSDQKDMVHTLRILSKRDDDHRLCIGDAGAIPHLVRLLSSPDPAVQEDAITCLLNTSIAHANKGRIVETRGAIDRIADTVRCGAREESRQNAATTLFSVLMVEEYRNPIGEKEGVMTALLELLQHESPRSRKDAIKALFHLSLSPLNKSRIIRKGTLEILLAMVERRVRIPKRDDSGNVDNAAADALALLTQLASCDEGVAALSKPKILALLVELLEPGESSRCREHASAALLALCQTGGDAVVEKLIEFDVCVSALCSLLSAGTQRAKSKAGALLQLLMVNERS
ncbi:U-box domain-containing protein 14 [Selaginella moellendorffii]|nr:U-box domain-containing protein 14 [Selaginella moellendorffii]|eukprot:XP_002968933.2 U-box domain-containing protein 14 [Selaginella moellendorffii]